MPAFRRQVFYLLGEYLSSCGTRRIPLVFSIFNFRIIYDLGVSFFYLCLFFFFVFFGACKEVTNVADSEAQGW
jgi:hypothetical protein